jgi:phosphopantothenoylcysteine synthetase/decarboxylase
MAGTVYFDREGVRTFRTSMGGDANTVLVIRGDTVEAWPHMLKSAVADRLANAIAEHAAH